MEPPRSSDGSEPIDIPDYYDRTLVRDVAVAPGGDRVAFTATEFDAGAEEQLASLFVVPADGSREPHRLTRTSGASSPTWSPDGSRLAFLAVRDEDVALGAATTKADEDDDGEGETGDDGDETDDDPDGETADADDEPDDEPEAEDADETENGEEEQQVWVFDLDLGGDARQVTTRPDGVSEFDWGPEGERLVAAARDPTDEQREYLDSREEGGPIEVERLQHKANGRGWLDEVRTYLFVVDLESREERRLDDAYAGGAMTELMGGRCFPAWGRGDRIAFVANHREDADDSRVIDLHTIAPDGTDHRQLTDGDVTAVEPSWSPDGERLAFVSQDPENSYAPNDLRVVGADEVVETLTADLDRTVQGCRWTAEDAVLAVVGDEGLVTLSEIGLDGNRRDAFPAQDAYTGLFGVDVDSESGVAGLVVTRPNELDAYALDLKGTGDTDGDDTEPVRLTEYNADFFERSRVECERVTFEPEPGVEVEGLASYPADAAFESERFPLIVDVHGGPVSFDQPEYRFRNHYWASEGFVVLNPNYRGSSSYGRSFSESIGGDWGPREAADVAAGVDRLVDRGWIDPDRVFVTGFSYGAMTTAFVLAYTDVATAGAAQHGTYDYSSAFGTDDTHLWWESDFGLPWEEPETFDRISTITEVERMNDPLLLTAGEIDWRCPPTQSEQLYVSLKKRGVDAKLVVYPDVPHARGPPPVATHRLETATDWFREHDPAVEDDADDGTNEDDADDGTSEDDADEE